MPLFLLHGFTGSRRTWTPLRDALEYPSVAMDLPGHGETKIQNPEAPFDIRLLTEELIRILDFLGAEKVHLCGYSMGGRLALAFALSHPERLASLILESASPGLAEDDARADRCAADAALAGDITTDFKRFLLEWDALPLFAGQRLRNPEGWRRNQEIRSQSNPAGLAWALRHFGVGVQPDYWDRLEGLELPILLVTGAEDEKFNRIAHKMACRLPGSTHVTIESAGHAPHLDQPEKFCRLVTTWLAEPY